MSITVTKLVPERVKQFEELREYATGEFTPLGDSTDTEQHHNAIWDAIHRALHERRGDDSTPVVEIRILTSTESVQHGWCWFPVALLIDLHSNAPLIHGVKLLGPYQTQLEADTAIIDEPHEIVASLLVTAQQHVSVDRFLAPREFNTPEITTLLNHHSIDADIPPSTQTTSSDAYKLAELHAQFIFDRLSWFPQPIDDISLRDALVTAVEVNAYGVTTQVVEEDNDIEISRSHDDFTAFTQWLRLYRRWPGAPETHTL